MYTRALFYAYAKIVKNIPLKKGNNLPKNGEDMKRLLILLIAILTLSFCLTGCNDKKIDPLADVGGSVVAESNGTFAVEKGNYLYFINGIGDSKQSNNMGDVTKGALCRVHLDNVGKNDAKFEVVIPKLMTVGSASNGVFVYGDTVYYATPYSEKDKTGAVRNDYTEFRYFDLKTANSKSICYETNSVNAYYFVQNGNSVYLAYEYTTTVEDAEKKFFRVLNSKGEEVKKIENYTGLSVATDNSGKVFFVKKAFSKDLDQEEAFSEVYSYDIGGSEQLVFSGCGTNGLTRDKADRDTAEYKAKILKYSDFSGATVSIIKNTGSILVMKVTGVDSIYSGSYYFGLNISDGITVANLKEMGRSNTYIDNALTATAYYKSLNEIYYVENTDYLKGLVKFDYNKLADATHGRQLVNKDAAEKNIAFVKDGYMYFSSTAGSYYRLNLETAGAELRQINGVPAKSTTDWLLPRVVNDKFICVLSDAIFGSYVYSIDMKDIETEEYKENLEKLSTLDREKVLAVNGALVGIKTEADKTSFSEKLDKDYPIDEDEE